MPRETRLDGRLAPDLSISDSEVLVLAVWSIGVSI
jgi:hypothetical protein